MQRHVDESNGDSSSDEGTKNTGSVEKSIEYSILQQILYKNKKHELPCSRIDRISDVTAGQILRSASFLTGTILLSGAALFFLAPDYVTTKLSLPGAFARYLLECPFGVRVSGAVASVMGSLCLLLNQLHRIGIFDRKVSLDKVDLLKGAVTTRA
ncbi:TPA: pcar domain protein, partial [Escherichia coli]|nr:pcar domain protein [Escherichia coli]